MANYSHLKDARRAVSNSQSRGRKSYKSPTRKEKEQKDKSPEKKVRFEKKKNHRAYAADSEGKIKSSESDSNTYAARDESDESDKKAHIALTFNAGSATPEIEEDISDENNIADPDDFYDKASVEYFDTVEYLETVKELEGIILDPTNINESPDIDEIAVFSSNQHTRQDDWIADSEASSYMIDQLDLFDYDPKPNKTGRRKVRVRGGELLIIKRGAAIFRPSITLLPNVL